MNSVWGETLHCYGKMWWQEQQVACHSMFTNRKQNDAFPCWLLFLSETKSYSLAHAGLEFVTYPGWPACLPACLGFVIYPVWLANLCYIRGCSVIFCIYPGWPGICFGLSVLASICWYSDNSNPDEYFKFKNMVSREIKRIQVYVLFIWYNQGKDLYV